MMLKFKVDENLPVEAADLFVSAGHDAITVKDQRMDGQPDWFGYSILSFTTCFSSS
jgi:hypothetical protein